MKKIVLALIASAATASAMAEVSIGSVSGLVTASVNNQMVNVSQGAKFNDGVTLNVPAGASVQVTVGDCTRTVTGPRSVVVDSANCKALVAGGGATRPANNVLRDLGIGLAGGLLVSKTIKGPRVVLPPSRS